MTITRSPNVLSGLLTTDSDPGGVRLDWLATGLCWLLAGVFWREPWKADEGYSFGIVVSMLREGHWLVPTLAGEPFLEKPPFVFWVAALAAKMLEGVLPLHVAARIGGTVLAAGAFGLVWSAGRLTLGQAGGRRAMLWLAACPAWLVGSGFLTADLGLVLACAMAVNGLVRLERAQPGAALWLGLAGVVGLLSKGLLMPGVLIVTLAVLLALRADLRERRVLVELGHAALIAAPLALLWPLFLWLRSPELFDTWFWANNVGRFIGSNRLGPPANPLSTLGNGLLYLMPLWPAALLAVAGFRRSRLPVGLASVAVFALIWCVVVVTSATARVNYLMPVMVPLAVLAAGWHPSTRSSLVRGTADKLPALVGVLLLGIVVGKGWLHVTMPESRWGSLATVNVALVLMAAVVAVAFLGQMRSGRMPSLLARWVAALTVVWCFGLGVFLKPADQTTGFRGLFSDIAQRLPDDAACVASHGLGESERGLLQYFGGLVTLRIESDHSAGSVCPVLIEQERLGITDSTDPIPFGCPGMTTIWSGSRPEDQRNAFRLCGTDPTRVSAAAGTTAGTFAVW